MTRVSSGPDGNSGAIGIRWKMWLMFFLLVCLISFVWSAPASLLPRIVAVMQPVGQSQAPGVTFSGTSGRLWYGRTEQLQIRINDQAVLLENVQWRLKWRSLMGARLCLDVSSEGTTRSFSGESCFGWSGSVFVNNLVFAMPVSDLITRQAGASMLLQTLNTAMQIQGEISGVIEQLHWRSSQLQQLQARGLWSDALVAVQLPDPRTLRINRQQLDLNILPWTLAAGGAGELLLHVFSLQSGDAGATDTPADLLVDSRSEIQGDGRFTTDLLLTLQDSTPRLLADILVVIAESPAPGVYRLGWRSPGL